MQPSEPNKNNSSRLSHWRRTVLQQTASIQDSIQNLNEMGVQIVLICDQDNKLVGTVSDGDIRRGLLKGLELSSSIASIIHRKPLVVPETMPLDLVQKLMTANKVRQVPIVDEANRVVGLHLWDQIAAPIHRSNIMIIMAGGKGTRLRPYTEACPKPLLEVAGKPMLEHIIQRAKSEGFVKFVLSVHYLGHMIESYFGDGKEFGVQISYLREDSPLGTAGALSLLEELPELPFVVTNGDVMTDIRYGELLDFHNRHEAAATMAVRLHEWQHPFGVVQMRGVEITGFEEKPVSRSHINAGVYVLSPSSLKNLIKNEICDMPSLFDRLKNQRQKIIAYPMHEPWLDVGNPSDYAKATEASIPAASTLI